MVIWKLVQLCVLPGLAGHGKDGFSLNAKSLRGMISGSDVAFELLNFEPCAIGHIQGSPPQNAGLYVWDMLAMIDVNCVDG